MIEAHIPDGAPADLFITEALDARPVSPADYRQETLAIQSLASHMADDPDKVLASFVDIALELTGAVSGGLSLYEAEPAPGVFRWHFLRGTLARFEGATTPRDFSPCGVTLDRNGPVLTLHPERVYSWLVDANVSLPEVLLVPLYLASHEPLGTLWVVSQSEGQFVRDHARILTELAAFVGIALRMRKGEQSLRRQLAQQSAVTREMSHRVRNVFAVTDGMIRLTARNAANKEEMAASLSGRLHALAKAHALIKHDLEDEVTSHSDLGALIQEVVRPHQLSSPRERFGLHGPNIPCGNHAITGLALIFHELATNSAKYGALSTDAGTVDVRWSADDGTVALSWSETGGPPVSAPEASGGFGAVLVKSTVTSQFGGTLVYDWRPEGLRLQIRLPRDRIAV